MQIELEREKILNALALILQDSRFMAAPKTSALLKYVVLQTLDGNPHRIKAYNIAIDALNKSESFDPQNDPCVRVMAKRLRDMMRDYYNRTTNHEIILQLYPGSYVPRFIESTEKSFDMSRAS